MTVATFVLCGKLREQRPVLLLCAFADPYRDPGDQTSGPLLSDLEAENG